MKPKLPKFNMKWFLHGAWVLMLLGVGSLWFFSGGENDMFSSHSHATFAEIQKLVVDDPKSISKLTFYKEDKSDTPSIVMIDGEKNLWADVPGTHDYNALTDAAEKSHVFKDGKNYNPDQANAWMGWFSTVAQVGVPILIFGVIFFMIMRGRAPGGMGNAQKHAKISLTRLDQREKPVKFSDVAGIDDELEKVRGIVFDIQNPEFLQKLGGRVPVGLQIVGPPGTGKTFIVQAIAGEAKIPVLSMSGSDFVEMYVGTGAARMRDAWAQARALRDKEKKWIILFCDEFDAVGRSRADGGGGNDERIQTVGQILVEIQGTQADNSRILFIVATNQPDSLDPAIVRAGRLGDMKIEVVAPDKEGRQAILNVKLKKVPASDDIKVEQLADEMPGLTGADIDTLVTKRGPQFAKMRLLERVPEQEAWQPGELNLDKYFADEDYRVTHADLWKALEEMTMGAISETKGRRLNPQIKRMISVHELGHFTVAMRKRLQSTKSWDAQYGDMIASISVLGPNGIGGFVKTIPEHDFKTSKNLKSALAIALAGNRAERLVLGDWTGGCSNDLQYANRVVKAMLLKLNMSDCNNLGWKLPAISVEYTGGSRYLGGRSKHAAQYGMSEDSAKQVDKFIDLFLREAEAEADAYIKEELDWIEWMAPKLVKAERMRFSEIEPLWNDFHNERGRGDLSNAVAFPYTWDNNHEGLAPVDVPELKKPD